MSLIHRLAKEFVLLSREVGKGLALLSSVTNLSIKTCEKTDLKFQIHIYMSTITQSHTFIINNLTSCSDHKKIYQSTIQSKDGSYNDQSKKTLDLSKHKQ